MQVVVSDVGGAIARHILTMLVWPRTRSVLGVAR